MAELIQLHQPTEVLSLEDAIESFLTSVDLAPSTVKVYRATLNKLVEDLGIETSLTVPTRTEIKKHLTGRYANVSPATYNRNLATISSFATWCVENELLMSSPTMGIRRRKQRVTLEAERQARPIPLGDLEAFWTAHKTHSVRDRCFWAMAYDTAARADELLGLNIQNMDTPNRQATIIGKGGNAEQIYWSSTTARLLPRLTNGRNVGPLFIGDRKPRSHLAPAASDLCPTTGRARLSYRRAEEIWKDVSGFTLHQLRHSRLTHIAEAGEDVTMIKAKSRHRSLRSLERYVNPSPDAIRDLTNRHDPNRRHP